MKRKKRTVFVLLVLFAGSILAYYDITQWAPQRLKPRFETLESTLIPQDLNNTSIALLSDVNGDIALLERAAALTREFQPDVIIFAGNLLSAAADEPTQQQFIDALASIEAPLGKFAVLSKSDYEVNYEMHKAILEASGFYVMTNTAIELHNRTETFINLVGIDGNVLADEREDLFFPSLPSETFTLSVVHDPDIINTLSSTSTQAVLSGKTLGGQFRLPFIGAILSDETYTEPRSNINGKTLIVSMGLGTDEPKLRMGTNPEIVLITLKSLSQ